MRPLAILLVLAMACSYAAVELLNGFGRVDSTGATFDQRTGAVLHVQDESSAALAGLRAGDRVDFSRSNWTLHLWLDRGGLLNGQAVVLPTIRNGKPHEVRIVGTQHATTEQEKLFSVIPVIMMAVYVLLGTVLAVMKRNSASFAFLIFCASAAFRSNIALMSVAPPALQPFAAFLATVVTTAGLFSYFYFALRFARTQDPGQSRYAQYGWLGYVFVAGALYYAHFFTMALLPHGQRVYAAYTVLDWGALLYCFVIFSSRFASERGPQAVRVRWVAAAMAYVVVSTGFFFIQQNLIATGVGSPIPVDWLGVMTILNPAPLAIAYALIQARIVDVRSFGGRTLVYALLTAIPIALFSVADWIFARRLADARLATIVEFAVAVLFGVSLNLLHKRIDRFVERVLFAARHRSFQRLRHVIHALPSTLHRESIEAMLTTEPAAALHLASAALFLASNQGFVRVAAAGWNDCAGALDEDDPLVLFPRSSHGTVHLPDVPPTASAIPKDYAQPVIAIPLLASHVTLGVALYGSHVNGEPIDPEEEQILSELAHASAGALERLDALQRQRTLEGELVRARMTRERFALPEGT